MCKRMLDFRYHRVRIERHFQSRRRRIEKFMSELTDLRVEKDEFFKNYPQSPLTPEQQSDFTGLQYFPENDALRLEVQVERLFEQQPICQPPKLSTKHK
jgi:uncharacterized protein (DUF1684 family)